MWRSRQREETRLCVDDAGVASTGRRTGKHDLDVEEESRNTYENAKFGANILRRHGIDQVALVVDARSMPRAAAVLEKQGIRVAPAPSRLREWDGLLELLPSWKAIKGNEVTLHEAVGYIWYKLHGWV